MKKVASKNEETGAQMRQLPRKVKRGTRVKQGGAFERARPRMRAHDDESPVARRQGGVDAISSAAPKGAARKKFSRSPEPAQ
jgi:hypothetical protein